MKILVACEYSGVVREAFARRGHDAWSCDLLPSDLPGQHITGDVRAVFNDGWDMLIAFPPCTYLSYAGARWWSRPGYDVLQAAALAFWWEMINAPIPRIAVENPRGIPWRYRRPDQVIEPYYFGHPVTKKTALWLKNLSPLMYTLICTNPVKNWTENVAAKSGHERARFWPGIAEAMANQWGWE